MTEMESKRRTVPVGVVTLVTCLAGLGAGGACGAILGASGFVFGASGGLVAGLVWSCVMIRKIRKGRTNLVGAGAAWGVGVGLLATAILHTGLFLEAAVTAPESLRDPYGMFPIVLAVGVVMAVVSGVIAGAMCGAMCVHYARKVCLEEGWTE